MKIFALAYTSPYWRPIKERSNSRMPDRLNIPETKVARILRHGTKEQVQEELQKAADLEVGESFVDHTGDTWTRTE